MKKILALISFCAVGALAQPTPPSTGTLMVNTTTGNIVAPVSAATFASANGLSPTSAIIDGAHGGTGTANTGKTITLAGNVTTSGAYNLSVTLTGNTSITLPASGTLATLGGNETLGNKTLTDPIIGNATVDNLTGATSGNVTITGGSNGASLILGQGVNGGAKMNLNGSGQFVIGAVTGLGTSPSRTVTIKDNRAGATVSDLWINDPASDSHFYITYGTSTEIGGVLGGLIALDRTLNLDAGAGALDNIAYKFYTRASSSYQLAMTMSNSAVMTLVPDLAGNPASLVIKGVGNNTIAQGPNLQLLDPNTAYSALIQLGTNGQLQWWQYYPASWQNHMSLTGAGQLNVDAIATGPLTILTSNGGSFAGGQFTRSANWGTFYAAPASGGVADLAFVDFAQLTGIRVLPTSVDTYVNVSSSSTKILSVGTTGATLSGNLTVSGTGTSSFAGIVTESTDTLSGAGAVSVTKTVTKFTSTGSGQALTLANGTEGQIKRIVHVVDGGSGVLTPTTKTGYSTITFTNAGDTVTLEYVATQGWLVIGSYGVTIAP